MHNLLSIMQQWIDKKAPKVQKGDIFIMSAQGGKNYDDNKKSPFGSLGAFLSPALLQGCFKEYLAN